MYLLWWYFLFLHFVLSYINLVDLSSIVYSVRLCTVHIGPSPPCQIQAKGIALHCLKHTQGATSAFINWQHNKCLNVYIFYCYGYRNLLPAAPEFYLVYPYHSSSSSSLCLFHPFLFFFAVLIDTSTTSSSVSVCNSETIGDYPPQMPPINPTPRPYFGVLWTQTLHYPGSRGRR